MCPQVFHRLSLSELALADLTRQPGQFLLQFKGQLLVSPGAEMINKEVEIIGVSDHLAAELPRVIELVRNGKVRFPPGTLRHVGLGAASINAVLDSLGPCTEHIRTVIVPTN